MRSGRLPTLASLLLVGGLLTFSVSAQASSGDDDTECFTCNDGQNWGHNVRARHHGAKHGPKHHGSKHGPKHHGDDHRKPRDVPELSAAGFGAAAVLLMGAGLIFTSRRRYGDSK